MFDAFSRGFVAVGWHELGDLTAITTVDAVRSLYLRTYPGEKAGKSSGAIAMLFKFRSMIRQGDQVVSYDPRSRDYLVGAIASDYFYDKSQIPGYPHLRKASWEGRIGRDSPTAKARNPLGSALTVFAIDDEVWSYIASTLGTDTTAPEQHVVEEKEALEES